MEWRRETLISCMDEMRQTRGHLDPRDVGAKNECDNLNRTRLTRRLRAYSRVHHVKCRVSCTFF